MNDTGFKTFMIVWLGQFASIIGSGLTGFALGVWMFLETGSVTNFALVLLCVTVPGIVVAPIAGVIIDRYDRRWVMIISDSIAALSTVFLFMMFFIEAVSLWQIYLVSAISSAASAFQAPAYTAAIPMLVQKAHLGRANGLVQFAEAAGVVIAPLLAGVLIHTISIKGIMIIDFITFLIAMLTLLFVRFPKLEKSLTSNAKGKRQLWKDVSYGWSYIFARPGLKGILIFIAASNFLLSFMNASLTPLILSFSNEKTLGIIVSTGGLGMIVGGLVMAIWGGPKRRIYGLLISGVISGVFVSLAGLKASPLLVGFALFVTFFFLPIGNGCSQVIWQSKVESAVQGRVFSFRRMIGISLSPIAYVMVGPLVDNVFEPSMTEGGMLASVFGPLIGTGPGRGIALLFVLAGFLWASVAIASLLNPRVRNVEDELPDALEDDAKGEVAPAPVG